MNHETVSLEGRYAPRDQQVLARQVANEMVVVDMHNGIYHGLNAVAVQIWQQLDGQRSLKEIADDLTRQFEEVDPTTIQADTLALVQSLLDNDLVVPR
jgi:coenzyme PQQ synthesis protein D (PqqD)